MKTHGSQEWPALSVQQPWAELLVEGRKSIEIRAWSTDYRGRLWLHASSKSQPELEQLFGLEDTYKGGFVGSILLSAIVPMTSDRWVQWRSSHLDAGQYRHGMFAWIMEAPHRFLTPVRGKGQLRLFEPSEDELRQLKAAESGTEAS
jgi:ASCH domain